MAKNRTELIHCDNCGEDYAATYRRCPFCDAKASPRSKAVDDEYEVPFDDDDDLDPVSPRGGKRLAGGQPSRGNGRGPRFWIRVGLYAFSAIIILLAIWLVCTQVLPKLLPSGEPSEIQETVSPSPDPSEDPSTTPSSEPTPSDELPLPNVGDPGLTTDDPLGLDNPDLPPVESDPLVTTTSPVTTTTAAPTGTLKLSSSDFTLSPKYPTYQMEIEGVGRAQATYTMANEAVATVSANGLITAVANGSTTLTVTDQNGATATAIVRVSGMSSQAAATGSASSPAPATSTSPSASGSSTSSAKLNYTDFSISATYPDPVQLKVSGGQASGWSSSNGNVAAVSSDGTVTGVGNGTAKITCTLTDGSTLTCTVYVSGK